MFSLVGFHVFPFLSIRHIRVSCFPTWGFMFSLSLPTIVCPTQYHPGGQIVWYAYTCIQIMVSIHVTQTHHLQFMCYLLHVWVVNHLYNAWLQTCLQTYAYARNRSSIGRVIAFFEHVKCLKSVLGFFVFNLYG